jgi:hypothetical protein
MELIQVLVGMDDVGTVFIGDALRVGGAIWLVPAWYEDTDGQRRKPVLAIRLPSQHCQPAPEGMPAHVLYAEPLPKAATADLTGGRARAAGFDVSREPEWWMPLPGGRH